VKLAYTLYKTTQFRTAEIMQKDGNRYKDDITIMIIESRHDDNKEFASKRVHNNNERRKHQTPGDSDTSLNDQVMVTF